MKKFYYLLASIAIVLVTIISCEKAGIESDELNALQDEEVLLSRPAPKVDVCHYDDGYIDVYDEYGIKTGETEWDHDPQWVTINISENALEAHLKHSDGEHTDYQMIDNDGDGYYTIAGSCTGDYADCDDWDAAINPGAAEEPYNGIDDDCNALTLDDDLDKDGFINAEDCDDSDAASFPYSPVGTYKVKWVTDTNRTALWEFKFTLNNDGNIEGVASNYGWVVYGTVDYSTWIEDKDITNISYSAAGFSATWVGDTATAPITGTFSEDGCGGILSFNNNVDSWSDY